MNNTEIIKDICVKVKEKLIYYMKKMNIKNPNKTSGLCVVYSCLIFKQLKKKNITTIFCTNEDHCFLMYEDKVIDMAGENNSEMILVSYNDIKYKKFWRIEHKFKNINDLMKSDPFIKENIINIFGIEFYKKLME